MTVRYLGMNSQTGLSISEVEHIRQSVRDILVTPVGSRVMRREYGSLLSALIDQPQTPALRLQIMAACYSAIQRWEPRVSLSTITVERGEDDGAMYVDMTGTRFGIRPAFFYHPSTELNVMAIVDLSQLAAPDVVEELDYETILTERKVTLVSLYPEEQQDAVARTLTLESEPIVKLLQENAYREIIWRQRVNESARAVMLAYAAGHDLDNLGANYNVERLVITPADETTLPPTPAVMESDTDYRLRIQQAFEGMSVAGSTGAYQFHGRSADGRVADISVISPQPACVTVSVLSRENNGAASGELLAVVRNALNDEDVRPVADRVTVQSAVIVDYTIDAALYLYPGPESEPVLSAAKAKLQAYINAQHRLGRDIRKSAIYAALYVEGVQRVELVAPVADIVLNETQASYCTAYSVNIGGNDE